MREHVGTLLKGRYWIERELGRGGIGVVYLARDKGLYDRPVVVKMLLEDRTNPQSFAYFLNRFPIEVKALARIRNAGVVSVLDTGETPQGLPYMVMEYVEGVALRNAMNEQGMELTRVGCLMRQIGRALMAAHDEGVIHRDLKPENIMLLTANNEETIKLIDFGIATVKEQQEGQPTVKTIPVGTPHYMAPEQLLGKPVLASDIYALGVIAYELVTGQLPFQPRSSPFELPDLQRAGVKLPPTSLRPELPLAAQEVILQALAYEPQARQRSPRELGDKLEQALCVKLPTSTGVYPVPGHLPRGTLLRERYRIKRRIGGSATSVYLAEDLRHGQRQVIVKEMHEQVSDEVARAAAKSAFNDAASLLARLTHTALPQVYDYFYRASQGRYYLVTEQIAGMDLAARLREAGGRLDERLVTDWASKICDALAYLHGQTPPLIYRDLNPTNVMIESQTNQVKLTDFGLTRVVAPPTRGLSETLGYVAPEIYRQQPEPRSDIYSLGALLFHLLTGQAPSESPLLIFDFDKNPKPRQLAPQMSAQLEQVICHAVEFRAEDRIASAQVFGQLLREHSARLQPSPPTLVEELVSCRQCGKAAEPSAIFCGACGRRLRLTGKLQMLSGAETWVEWELATQGETLLGRLDPQQNIEPEVDLTKHDPTSSVSRRHAQISRKNDQFFLKDVGSANGTFLSGATRLPPNQPHLLTNGAELKLGDVRLRFVILD